MTHSFRGEAGGPVSQAYGGGRTCWKRVAIQAQGSSGKDRNMSASGGAVRRAEPMSTPATDLVRVSAIEVGTSWRSATTTFCGVGFGERSRRRGPPAFPEEQPSASGTANYRDTVAILRWRPCRTRPQ